MPDHASNQPLIDQQELIDGIIEWISHETPTYEAEAVNRLADLVQLQFETIGAVIERHPGEQGFGDTVFAHVAGEEEAPGILVLSHIDTVHPIGTAMGENKIRIDGDKLYGPGVYDMKAGAFIAHYAARHLHRRGITPKLPITFMYVPEEEIGSPYSRRLIEAAASKAKYVLVTEPARDGGKLVVSRKGVGRFDLKTIGQPSHSGAKHEDGRSAIKEMARLILEIEAMTDYETGVTFNVGQIKGGTGVNVVPRECSIEVDMRVVTPEQGDDYVARVFALQSSDPDVELIIEGEMNRPPFEATKASMDLFAVARECALETGLDLQTTVTTGGGSDGNFTAAMGIPTIDGMGADGAGAHTLYEHVLISSLVPMSEMWWRLLARLT